MQELHSEKIGIKGDCFTESENSVYLTYYYGISGEKPNDFVC